MLRLFLPCGLAVANRLRVKPLSFNVQISGADAKASW